MPPLPIVAELTVPPDTVRTPLLVTVVASATPPGSAYSSAPDIASTALVITPAPVADTRFNPCSRTAPVDTTLAPASTVVPVVTPPGSTTSVPPGLMSPPLSVPPLITTAPPLLTTVPLALP